MYGWEKGRYLWGYVNCSVWDVHVPNDEDEAGCHGCGGVIIEGLTDLKVCSRLLARSGYLDGVCAACISSKAGFEKLRRKGVVDLV